MGTSPSFEGHENVLLREKFWYRSCLERSSVKNRFVSLRGENLPKQALKDTPREYISQNPRKKIME